MQLGLHGATKPKTAGVRDPSTRNGWTRRAASWCQGAPASPAQTARDNRERFSLGGAAHDRDRGAPKVGSAPVSEKRIGLNGSPCRQVYGR
jgi:hypothetical protein